MLRALIPTLVVTVGLVLAGCGEGGDESASAAPSHVGDLSGDPTISFERLVHDFGMIDDSATRQTSFRFTNTGTGTLVIASVKASCGCTIPTLERMEYLPGETGAIEVAFEPRGRSGETDKTITVVSNSKPYRVIKLEINSLILPLLKVAPWHKLDKIRKGRDFTTQIELTYEDPDLVISEVSVDHPNMTARVAESGRIISTFEGRNTYRAVIEVTISKDAPWGAFYKPNLHIKAQGRSDVDGNPVENDYAVKLTGWIEGELRADPPIVAVGVLDPGDPFEGSATLTRAYGEPLTVLEARVVDSPVPDVEVRVEPVDRSRVRIVVTGSVGDEIRGTLDGGVLIRTNVPGEDAVTLRFSGWVRERN